VCLNSVTKTD